MELTEFDREPETELTAQTAAQENMQTVPELLRQEEEAEQRHQPLRETIERERSERMTEIARRGREMEDYFARETAERDAFKAASKRRTGKTLRIVVPILVIVLVLAALTPEFLLPLAKHEIAYQQAKTMLKNGQYDDARDAFAALDGYRDSADKALEAVYQKASRFLEAEEYDAAWELFNQISDYSDAAEMAQECRYRKALWLEGLGRFEEAIDIWSEIAGYADSADCIARAEEEWKEADYQAAMKLLDAGDYSNAAGAFKALGDYKDSAQRYQEAVYAYGCALLKQGDYDGAAKQFVLIDSYSDAHEKYLESNYKLGCSLLEKKQYTEAVKAFEKCAGYSDANELLLKAKYGYVAAHTEEPDSVAKAYLKALQDANYPGADALYKQVYRWRAEVYAINNGQYDTTNRSSVSKYQTIYFHYRVFGGEPGGKTDIRIVIRTPDGQTYNGNITGCTDGSDWYSWFRYNNPSYARGGNITITIYDTAGNVLATGSAYYG